MYLDFLYSINDVLCILSCFDWNDLDVAILGCVVPVKLVSTGFYVVLN